MRNVAKEKVEHMEKKDLRARVCRTQELFLRSFSRSLSDAVVKYIVEFGAPSIQPSAQALKAMYIKYPWVGPMQRALPEVPFSWFALKPEKLGLAWCCNGSKCPNLGMRRIRRKYDVRFDRIYDDDFEDSHTERTSQSD